MIAADRQSCLDYFSAKTCRIVNGGAIAPFILPLTILCVFAILRETTQKYRKIWIIYRNYDKIKAKEQTGETCTADGSGNDTCKKYRCGWRESGL